MDDKVVYNLSDENDRRTFFGIDADSLEGQAFRLENKEDVIRFDDLLNAYVDNEIHLPFTSIDLTKWYDWCLKETVDGRLFTAIYDLKITTAFIFIDSIKAVPDFDSLNRRDSTDVLSDPVLFEKRMQMLHKNVDLVALYRAFYDKLMGVLVLMKCPGEYKSFVGENSRLKAFERTIADRIDETVLRVIMGNASDLNNSYRTAEIHQSGRMRKWVLGGQNLFLDYELDYIGNMNRILSLSSWLDGLL